MKKKFSTAWKASSQPRKQVKYRANAPLHLKRKFVNLNLSKDLKKKLGKRSLQAKKGDKVKVMRGKFKGKTGKILEVNIKYSKIIVEGMQVKKQDGSKANVKMQPSNLQIIEMADRKFKQPKTTSKDTSESKTPKKVESKIKSGEKK